MSNHTEDRLVNVNQLAELAGVCRRTILNWRKSGRLPPGLPIGGKVRVWRLSEVAHLLQT